MSTADCCEFPLFRRKFLGAALWNSAENSIQPEDSAAGSSNSNQAHGSNRTSRPTLGNLDLKALPRDDGPPSESQQRRQKFLYFEKHCSEIADGLFLSSDYVAKNLELITASGITHVLNCVGFICQEYFKNKLQYKTLFLQDTPAEDILCVLYECFDFIEAARSSGGRVLVHCSQGVSRSASVVIAYLMWKTNQPYDEVFARVKAIRGIANPNIGFTCQLLQWQKRRAVTPSRPRLYRIAPHCQMDPLHLVPKPVISSSKFPHVTYRDLDPRGAFVLHTSEALYVWRGLRCPACLADAAQGHAHHVTKYEAAHLPPLCINQGDEPDEFLEVMDPSPLAPDQQRTRRDSLAELSMGGSGDASMVLDVPNSPYHLIDTPPSPMHCDTPTFTFSRRTLSTPPEHVYSQSPADGSKAVPMRMRSLPEHANAENVGSGDSRRVRVPLPIVEVDEYTDEYVLYFDALRASGVEVETEVRGLTAVERARLRNNSLRVVSDGSMMAVMGVGVLGGGMGWPGLGHSRSDSIGLVMTTADDMKIVDAPNTAEGRMKKSRHNSDGTLPNSRGARHFPSLHTSIDEEDMTMM